MRKRKYKIWDTEENKWFEPVFEAYNRKIDHLLIGTEGELFRRTFDEFQHESIFPNRYIIVDYTGLKDKSGEEIYEGDIVKWDFASGGGMGDVYWKESEGGFYHTFTDEDGDVRPSKRLWDIIEVIGNIYENPELLK